jgi:hypothetical protein
MELKGFKQVDGTAEGFDRNSLENGYVYFVRTTESKEFGYIYLNGKVYGEASPGIDCGTY